jgi:hypothetical protein
VDWKSADCDINVAIVRGTCTLDQFNNDTCPLLTYSSSTTAKPERLVLPNASPARYSLYIGNLGPDTESVSYQVTLTTGGTNVSSTARPGVGEWPKGSMRVLKRDRPQR